MTLNRQEEDCKVNRTEELSERDKSVIEKLGEFYATSTLYKNTKAELDKLQVVTRSVAFKENTHMTSSFHQLRWIAKHSFKNSLCNP